MKLVLVGRQLKKKISGGLWCIVLLKSEKYTWTTYVVKYKKRYKIVVWLDVGNICERKNN